MNDTTTAATTTGNKWEQPKETRLAQAASLSVIHFFTSEGSTLRLRFNILRVFLEQLGFTVTELTLHVNGSVSDYIFFKVDNTEKVVHMALSEQDDLLVVHKIRIRSDFVAQTERAALLETVEETTPLLITDFMSTNMDTVADLLGLNT